MQRCRRSCQWSSSHRVGGGTSHIKPCAGAQYSQSPRCWKCNQGAPCGAIDKRRSHEAECEQADGVEHRELRWYRPRCLRFSP
jgi:hypothetical protein